MTEEVRVTTVLVAMHHVESMIEGFKVEVVSCEARLKWPPKLCGSHPKAGKPETFVEVTGFGWSNPRASS